MSEKKHKVHGVYVSLQDLYPDASEERLELATRILTDEARVLRWGGGTAASFGTPDYTIHLIERTEGSE